MKPKKRQKLCPNCDGEADLDVIVCPFCAADLTGQEGVGGVPDASSCRLAASLYPSPSDGQEISEAIDQQETPIERVSIYRTIGSIALFSVGVYCFLLGLVLILFSREGILVFKWSARFWFLYLLASVPLLLFGYRSITKIDS